MHIALKSKIKPVSNQILAEFNFIDDTVWQHMDTHAQACQPIWEHFMPTS